MILRAKNEGDDETSTILAEVESLRIKESKNKEEAEKLQAAISKFEENLKEVN
jgi:hypothetical protein